MRMFRRITILLALVAAPLTTCDQQRDGDRGQVRVLDRGETARASSPASRKARLPAIPKNAPAYDPSRTAFGSAPLNPKPSKP
jgi:hypothetical protein